MSQVIYPLFVALTLKFLFRRRDFYFAEHLIFALHVLAFSFVISALLWPVYALFGLRTSNESVTAASLVITAGSMLWTGVYLLLAIRRAYAEPWPPAAIKGAVVFVSYFLTAMLFVYAALGLAIAFTRGAG
jgi:hypothetical protein